jgi:hypothetical protein
LARFASILLALAFLALGTGGLEFLHNLEHQREDARQASIALKSHQRIPAAPTHDESNCPIHFQLHLPIFFTAWTPLLVALGLFVAFLTLLAPSLNTQRAYIRLDCRGPPSCT